MAHASPAHPSSASIGAVVDQLCANPAVAARQAAGVGFEPPSPRVLVDVLEGLRSVLFPGYFGLVQMTEGLRFHIGAILEEKLRHLQEQILRGLVFAQWGGAGNPERLRRQNEQRAAAAARQLLTRLPELQRLVLLDVEAAYTGDPAAISHDEVIFSYPGVRTIIQHRISHELYLLDIPLIPRIVSEHAHGTTGIDIHPGATIGESFFIDHGTGVVIGETCEIGRNVRIYQGATLGAKSFPLDRHGQPVKGIPRHPIVEDDVIIYSGATILGRTRLGRGCIIGANAWVTRDVEPGAIVTRDHGEKDDLRVELPG